ncbi:hypothetical protein [Janthinobacterium aquaticum]|uniref:hypothetical protein n=1 Tax=Janthinobacterium sp. FT58W TaxID=2654254 RepID=UPI0012659521|nr:hypothetical protein [Janthinobacterium sp. FT58W]KAB8037180.1 hypothetical protein GCM43_23960 [Janthinobacterium sp. FT58W]
MPLHDAAADMPRERCWRHLKDRSFDSDGNRRAHEVKLQPGRPGQDACAGRCLCGHGMHGTILRVTCTGPCSHCKTLRHRFGFQRACLRRKKTALGFRTGDMVMAMVPSDKGQGVHKGHIPICMAGNFNTQSGLAGAATL